MIPGMTQQFSVKSERIKAIDVHPSLPLAACGLYNGTIAIYDTDKQSLVQTLSVGTAVPVRAVHFVEAINALLCGADDSAVHVFCLRSFEQIKVFQAHMDFIRCIAVSAAAQLVMSGGDDSRLNVWSWSNDWAQRASLTAHSNYVMDIAVSPADPFLFCSASLDKTVRIWGVQPTKAGFTVPADARVVLRHPSGVNCATFHPEAGAALPYIISGADDRTVRVWDYHNRAVVFSLVEHTDCVTSLAFVYATSKKAWKLVSGAEDGFVNTYDTQTYQLETRRQHSGGRVWALKAARTGGAAAATVQAAHATLLIGSDTDFTLEAPRQCATAAKAEDRANGRYAFSSGCDVFVCDLKDAKEISAKFSGTQEPSERSRVHRLAAFESPVTAMEYDPAGQYLAVACLDSWSVLSTRTGQLCGSDRCAGDARKSFAWGSSTGQFAVLTSRRSVQFYENFKKAKEIRLDADTDSLYIGAKDQVLCAVHTNTVERKGTVSFYDAHSGKKAKAVCFGGPIGRISWNPSGTRMAIRMADTVYFVEWSQANAAKGADPFSSVREVDVPMSGAPQWVDDTTIFYLNAFTRRVEYILDGETYCALKGNVVKQIARGKEGSVHFFGYFPRENKIYFVCSPAGQLSSSSTHCAAFPCAVVAFQKSLMADATNMERLARIASHVPAEFYGELAAFCAAKGHPGVAMQCFPQLSPKSRLAIALEQKDLETACRAARELADARLWEKVGVLAMQTGNIDAAIEALTAAESWKKLIVLLTAHRRLDALERVYQNSCESADTSMKFTAAHLAKNADAAHAVLEGAGALGVAEAYRKNFQNGRKQAEQNFAQEFTQPEPTNFVDFAPVKQEVASFPEFLAEERQASPEPIFEIPGSTQNIDIALGLEPVSRPAEKETKEPEINEYPFQVESSTTKETFEFASEDETKESISIASSANEDLTAVAETAKIDDFIQSSRDSFGASQEKELLSSPESERSAVGETAFEVSIEDEPSEVIPTLNENITCESSSEAETIQSVEVMRTAEVAETENVELALETSSADLEDQDKALLVTEEGRADAVDESRVSLSDSSSTVKEENTLQEEFSEEKDEAISHRSEISHESLESLSVEQSSSADNHQTPPEENQSSQRIDVEMNALQIEEPVQDEPEIHQPQSPAVEALEGGSEQEPSPTFESASLSPVQDPIILREDENANSPVEAGAQQQDVAKPVIPPQEPTNAHEEIAIGLPLSIDSVGEPSFTPVNASDAAQILTEEVLAPIQPSLEKIQTKVIADEPFDAVPAAPTQSAAIEPLQGIFVEEPRVVVPPDDPFAVEKQTSIDDQPKVQFEISTSASSTGSLNTSTSQINGSYGQVYQQPYVFKNPNPANLTTGQAADAFTFGDDPYQNHTIQNTVYPNTIAATDATQVSTENASVYASNATGAPSAAKAPKLTDYFYFSASSDSEDEGGQTPASSN